jgi:membrane protein
MNQPELTLHPRMTAWEIVKNSAVAWMDDYAPSMGAALAYYTVFSLAPLLLLVIAVAGIVFGADAARGEIVGQIGGLIGKEGATAVEGLLKSASSPGKSIVASVISLVTLIIGATSVFGELQSDLDRIWRAPAAPQSSGLWSLLQTRLLSLGLVASLGFLLLVSLVVGALLTAIGSWWGAWFGAWTTVLQIVNQLVSFATTAVLFGLMYRILPRVHVGWRDVMVGSVATAALFTLGKYVIGLYLGKAGVSSGFGAAGSVVVLLVWVYYSAQIFLFGAEFTWVYAHAKGSKSADPNQSTAAAAPGNSVPAQSHDTAKPGVPGVPSATKSKEAEEVPASVAAASSAPSRLEVKDYVGAAAVSLGFGAFQWYLRKRRRDAQDSASNAEVSAELPRT